LRRTLLLLLLTACNMVPQVSDTPDSPTPSPEDTAAAEAATLQAECTEQVDDLLEALNALDSRLNVGVQFDVYLGLVGDARVEYDGTDFDEMDIACLQDVGVPLEAAMRKYAQAAGVWNKCIGDFGCSNADIRPTLQKQWAAATAQITKAEDGLDDLA
jgi:hypothetical protein